MVERRSIGALATQTVGLGYNGSTARNSMKTFVSSLLSLFAALACAQAYAQEIPGADRLILPAESLKSDALAAERRSLPIVIFISQHGCPYCAALREKILYPMIRAGETDKQMILREVSLDAGFQLIDFDGETVSGRDFAGRYAATITPTLLFLDATGTEVARSRVGIGNIEFYAYYLEQSLASAAVTIVSGQ